jgi:hypothetical protein
MWLKLLPHSYIVHIEKKKNMERHTGDNLGSFHTLWIAKAKGLSNENFSTKIFEQVYFTPNSGNFIKKMASNKNGDYYQLSISFAMPKYREDAEKFCLDYIDVPCIAYIQTHNGDFIQIGSQRMPLFIELNLDTGEGVQGNNSYTCKGNALELIKPIGYKNFVPTPPPPTPTVGNGLKFNGSNNYGIVPHNDLLNFGTNDFSLSFVINPKNYHTGIIFSKWAANPFLFKGFEAFIRSNGKIGIGLLNGDGNFIFADTAINMYVINKLQHFIIQRKANSIEIYKDGNILPITYTIVGSLLNINQIDITNNTQSLFGVEEIALNSYPFNGFFYDFKIFNKALSPSEVSTLYNSKGNTNPAISNTVANYTFNQNSGNILLDSSTNNLHGTLYNFNTNQGITNQWVDENGNPV